MVRLKGFEPSRDYLPLRPQRMGRIGFRPAAFSCHRRHNVSYDDGEVFRRGCCDKHPAHCQLDDSVYDT